MTSSVTGQTEEVIHSKKDNEDNETKISPLLERIVGYANESVIFYKWSENIWLNSPYFIGLCLKYTIAC